MCCHRTWAVKCDCCGERMPGVFEWQEWGLKAAEKAGWWVVRGHKTICPECKPSVEFCPHCDGTTVSKTVEPGLPCRACKSNGLVLKPGSPLALQVQKEKEASDVSQ